MLEFIGLFSLILLAMGIGYLCDKKYGTNMMSVNSSDFDLGSLFTDTTKQQSAKDDEIASLKQRVAVLEKLVTDSQYDLKRQIDNL
ncbi:hypothetical protein E2K93_06880 [Thalassotalea sp. HSM 43]|uniref:hypothetical protein n=1 Tax=Thalassotalea sp. HSM 43 TaxID=2552945 RepID=UPI0010803CAD|nr:hypothetical protein [Thalassotalea sp. HSM 43]QBY04124.1 hypothetical protein E2K93_06880 [Thalassotalea sp. HSM 43]